MLAMAPRAVDMLQGWRMALHGNESWDVVERLGGGSLCVNELVRARDGRVAVRRQLRAEYHSDRARRLMVREEAELLLSLAHPNLRRCFSFRDEPPTQLLEHIDGADLGSFLAVMRERGQRFEPERALDVVGQLAPVLAYLHDHHVWHLDVTPDNVLIERSGRVVLCDLTRGQWPTRETMIVREAIPHKIGYTAPELWNRAPGGAPPAGYQLGVLLWEMLAGTSPTFVVEPRLGAPLPPLVPLVRLRDDLPTPLFALVHQLTSREPRARPTSGDDIERLIRRARAG